MRYLVGLLALLYPALASSQTTQTSVTAAGDTVITAVYARALPVTPVVVVDSILTTVKRAAVKPDTVQVPMYLPAPAPRIDTAFVVSPYPLGKPYGPFSICTSYTGYATGMPGPFTSTLCSTGPSGIVPQLQAARAAKIRLILAMTGGDHSQYITNGKFDYAKWKAKQAAYFTPTIKAAVDSALRDGTLIGNSIMDEPDHTSWGGVMTHALLDSMSRYMKSYFPALPTAIAIAWDWQKTQAYTSVDFIIPQYSYKKQYGDIRAYRDSALVSAKRQGVRLALAFNLLDGGNQPADYARALTDLAYWQSQCPYGTGTLRPNCRMSPAQVLEASKVFSASEACLVTMWRYDASFMQRADNLAVFAEAATYAARQPAPPCRRP